MSDAKHRRQREAASEQLDRLLFAKVDGELDADKRARLEQLLKNDAAAHARSSLFSRLDTGLHEIAQFDSGEPHTDARNMLQTAIEQADDDRPVHGERQSGGRAGVIAHFSWPRKKWLGYAAAAAISVIAALAVRESMTPSIEPIDAHRTYAMLAPTLEPRVVCDTPEKFVEYTKRAFGETIRADFEAGVALIGWNPVDSPGYDPENPRKGRRLLLARGADGSPIIALFDPFAGPSPTRSAWPASFERPAPATELFIHSGAISGVRVHELSLSSSPRLLPILAAE